MEVTSRLDSHARICHKFIAFIQPNLRAGATKSTVAKSYGVDWSTIKRLDKELLEHCFSEIDMRGVKHLFSRKSMKTQNTLIGLFICATGRLVSPESKNEITSLI